MRLMFCQNCQIRSPLSNNILNLFFEKFNNSIQFFYTFKNHVNITQLLSLFNKTGNKL